jgi:hypothetical protein
MRTIQPDGIRDLREHAHIVTTYGAVLIDRSPPSDDEIWHEVGSGSTPPFENGWQNHNPNSNPCSYRKDASGFVHLRGLVKGLPATGTAGISVIFTLPASWSPSGLEEFPCRFQENQIGELDFIYIRPNGQVCLRWPVAGPTLHEALFLDNYRWRAA